MSMSKEEADMARDADAAADDAVRKPHNYTLPDVLLSAIETAEQSAHKMDFHVTAHALNRAKNACGWEIAGDVEQAGRASRDERAAR